MVEIRREIKKHQLHRRRMITNDKRKLMEWIGEDTKWSPISVQDKESITAIHLDLWIFREENFEHIY